jgi:glycerol uptake facilitator-like aquaporin
MNSEDSPMLDMLRPPLAEFITMTLFVWCACANAIAVLSGFELNPNAPFDATNSFITPIALLNGFIIAVLIYTTGHVSGAHMNPAVTVAFAVAGQMPSLAMTIAYIVAQCVGSTLGAALAWGTTASRLLTDGMYCTRNCTFGLLFLVQWQRDGGRRCVVVSSDTMPFLYSNVSARTCQLRF